jgi:hypothetical protein
MAKAWSVAFKERHSPPKSSDLSVKGNPKNGGFLTGY